jgi:hypothetical protein
MAEIDRLFRQIPYAAGFSPTAFHKISDFAIVKKSGIFDVELMRTIQLMVAAFNMNNKHTGGTVMQRAELLCLIPPDQYGSRKCKLAILAALNKVLMIDLSRLRRLPMALCSNDAKSCYDRIVLWIAALSLLQMGAARSAVAEMMQTLLQAWHFVIIAFRESTRRYRGTNHPLQGVGQGNGATPAIWAVTSAVLLGVMRDEGFRLNLLTVSSLSTIVIAGFAFVDNTDLLHAGAHPQLSDTSLVPQMQRVVDTWEGLLRATGGVIREDKSYWYLINYEYHQGRWKYLSKLEAPGELDVKVVDCRGQPRAQRVLLTRFKPSEARETLGVYTPMDGNWRRQKQALTALAQRYAEYIRTQKTNRDTTWYAFNTSFMITLECSMEAICLSQAEWDDVMSPSLGITLQRRCGIASTFPRDLFFTLLQFQGSGVRHPFFQQMLSHLATLVAEASNPDSATGTLLTAVAEDL